MGPVWELVTLSRKHANVAEIWSVGRLWLCRDASGGWIMHIFALGVYQLRKVGNHSRTSIPAKFSSRLSECIVPNALDLPKAVCLMWTL